MENPKCRYIVLILFLFFTYTAICSIIGVESVRGVYCTICAESEDRMTDSAKEARRAYKRAWAKANPEKVKEAQRKYWEKRAAADPATTERAHQ